MNKKDTEQAVFNAIIRVILTIVGVILMIWGLIHFTGGGITIFSVLMTIMVIAVCIACYIHRGELK